MDEWMDGGREGWWIGLASESMDKKMMVGWVGESKDRHRWSSGWMERGKGTYSYQKTQISK